MAGAHDPGDPGLYSSPDLQVEFRFRERYLYSLASAVASLVTDSTSSTRGLANIRHRLSGRAFTNLKQFSVFLTLSDFVGQSLWPPSEPPPVRLSHTDAVPARACNEPLQITSVCNWMYGEAAKSERAKSARGVQPQRSHMKNPRKNGA